MLHAKETNTAAERSGYLVKRGIHELTSADKEHFRASVEEANRLDMELYARASQEVERRARLFGIDGQGACSLDS